MTDLLLAPAVAGSRARRRAAAQPVSYDFKRPIQLSREHSRTLQLRLDGYARQATTVFTSALRTVCQVSLASIDQRSYAEYIQSLGGSTYMTVFSADPMPGSGIFEMPLGATMLCVDHMLGGPVPGMTGRDPLHRTKVLGCHTAGSFGHEVARSLEESAV